VEILKEQIRVALVDEHPVARAGIRAVIGKVPGVQIIGEANDGHQCLALVEAENPDVIFMEAALPGMSGLEVAALINSRFANVRVIIVSMDEDEGLQRRAIAAGACGYLSKEAPIADFEVALREVVQGRTYVGEPRAKRKPKGPAAQVRDLLRLMLCRLGIIASP
jgi:DNA-binding NarL/FixJ family response regulator